MICSWLMLTQFCHSDVAKWYSGGIHKLWKQDYCQFWPPSSQSTCRQTGIWQPHPFMYAYSNELFPRDKRRNLKNPLLLVCLRSLWMPTYVYSSSVESKWTKCMIFRLGTVQYSYLLFTILKLCKRWSLRLRPSTPGKETIYFIKSRATENFEVRGQKAI